MKIKKALVILLTAAMVMTSSSFTSVVNAAEVQNGEKVEAVAEEEALEQSDEAAPKSEAEASGDSKVTAGDVAADDETAISDNAADEVKDEVKESETDETVKEEDATVDNHEKVDDSLEAVVDEADSDEEIDEEADSVEIIDETIDEEDAEAEETEDALEGDDENIASADDYFITETVGEDVYLRMKPGAVLAKNVTIPAAATVIPADIFRGDSIVENIYFEPDSQLTTIKPRAFMGSRISYIKIPAGVTELAEKVFDGATRLSDLQFDDPDSIKIIKESALKRTAISSIVLPECTEVEESAFEGCENLETVKMKKLTTINESAFSGCTSLGTGFAFGSMKNISYIGDQAFYGCGFVDLDISSLENIVSESNNAGGQKTGATLGNYVFANNTKLKNIISLAKDDSEKITYIPSGTFAGCTSLVSSINLPLNTKTIGSSAFENCTSLKSIDLKDNTRFINSKAFAGCSSLTTVRMGYKDETDQTHVVIVKDAFPDKSGVEFKGYDSSVEEYSTNMGYLFTTLYPKHNVVSVSSRASVTFDDNKKLPGEVVSVTVKYDANNPLSNIIYKIDGSNEKYRPEFVGIDKNKDYMFSFVMPDADVTVVADGVALENVKNTSLIYDFVDDDAEYKDGVNPEQDGTNSYYWAQRGMSAKLKFQDNGYPMGNWLFKYSSSNANIVTVTDEGVIVGVSEGWATITATPSYNTGKKVSFVVRITAAKKTIIGQVYAGKDSAEIESTGKSQFIDPGKNGMLSLDPITGYPVVTFTKAVLSQSAQTVNINIDAYTFNDDKAVAVYNDSTSYFVKSSWKSEDTSIATVAKATSTTNSNVITVKKGSEGESQISISTLNDQEKSPNDFNVSMGYAEDNIAFVTIKVIDITPRLVDTTFTVNHQVLKGTPITLVPVYGYELSDDGDRVLYFAKKVVKNGITSYITDAETKQFNITKDGAYWYVSTTNSVGLGYDKKVDYKNWYLCGSYKDATKDGFVIPVKQITLKNEKLKPKITQSGSINLFYNSTALPEEQGKVVISQSLTNYEVESYALVSTANHQNPGSELNPNADARDENPYKMTKKGVVMDYDSLSYNFDIATDLTSSKYSRAIVTRCDSFADLAKDKNANVVSGYLYIQYVGYRDPVMVSIKINTNYTAPTYYLSQTTATAYSGEVSQVYPLYLYPKGKSNSYINAVDLSKSYVVDTDNNTTKFYINYDSLNTTAKVDENQLHILKEYVDESSTEKYKGLKNKYIRIVADGVTASGNAVISLHMTSWSDASKYLYYKFTMKTTNDLKPTMSTSKINLNNAFVGGDDVQKIVIGASSSDAKITSLTDFKDYANAKYPKQVLSYNILKGLISYNNDTISVIQPRNVDDANSIENGTYTFSVVPKATLPNAGSEKALAMVKFSIVVKKAAPTISVGNLTLNTVAGNDLASSSLKIGNTIAGTTLSDYTVIVDDTDTELDPSVYEDFVVKYTRKGAEYYGLSVAGSNETTCFETKVANVWYDTANGLAKAMKGTDFCSNNYANVATYTVSGARVMSRKGAVATAANYSLPLKANKNAPYVKVKKSGEINIAAPSTEVIFDTTVYNTQGTITGAKVFEVVNGNQIDDTRFRVFGWTSTQSGRIRIRMRDDWTGKASLGWDSEEIKANQNYKLMIVYGLSTMGGYTKDNLSANSYDVACTVDVKPVQKFPKLTVSNSRSYAYAGQSRSENYGTTELTNNQWDIIVTAQVEQAYRGKVDLDGDGATESNYINIKGIDWAKSVNRATKDEFSIVKDSFSYDPATGVVKFAIRLRNASEQIQNKKYTLKFATMVDEIQVTKNLLTGGRKPLVEGTNFSIDITVKK